MATAASDLDAIADELYALRPDEFAAARDERIKQLRASGDAALAREIAKLRRPTQSAWLINSLWRDQREVMQQLLELADDLARAQASLSGPELRTLTAQRRQIETALLQRGEALAAEAGIDVTPAMAREAQDTLAAAFAQPEVAAEVRSGRLVKPVAYAGFGGFGMAMPDAGATPRQAAPKTTPVEAEPKPERKKVVDLQTAQREKEEERARQRRETAQRLVDEAQAAVDVAAEELADRTKTADAAQAKHQELRQRMEELQAELRQTQADAIAADKDARTAAHRRDYAQKEHAEALRMLEQAQRKLAELP